jgi:hypothetical protein
MGMVNGKLLNGTNVGKFPHTPHGLYSALKVGAGEIVGERGNVGVAVGGPITTVGSTAGVSILPVGPVGPGDDVGVDCVIDINNEVA